VKGLGIDQSDTIIATLTSTLNYPDHLPIIYRDRSHSSALITFKTDQRPLTHIANSL